MRHGDYLYSTVQGVPHVSVLGKIRRERKYPRSLKRETLQPDAISSSSDDSNRCDVRLRDDG